MLAKGRAVCWLQAGHIVLGMGRIRCLGYRWGMMCY